ncbi:hypothetical protein [Falsiroseomonas selenitidurans]|uniref:Uncharacterized protein n=1 Tax=Falsiroseomonas selenitidurans TaxID=2716335 RepID=A0ABX1E865_9PROT|nr:hypothetical protein [Falsiroseomonas selenitidurans]NKC33153.1 hypothetical protein [Falsiroseomonas selenitidurans]
MDSIPHGPFLVSQHGALTPVRRPALRFAWRGRGCEATFSEGQLSLAAQAGAVPYTAEHPAARPAAFAALGRMPRELPAGWRLRLLPDHRVQLESAVPLAGAPTATELVREMVRFALALDPYLDRLESAGVAGGAGMVKT